MTDKTTPNSDDADAKPDQTGRANPEMPIDIELSEETADPGAEDGRIKRKFARYAAPLVVVINNHCYNALDWSLGGFRIGEARDLGLAGERVSATILIKFEGFAMSFSAMAELVRLDPATREAAFRFTELTPEQTRFLSHFSSAFLAGRMQSIDGVLKHTRPEDDRASSQGDENDKGASNERRRNLVKRSVLVVAAIAALLTMRMSVLQMVSVSAQAAWIEAPTVTLAAPGAAKVVSVSIADGDIVRPGDILAELTDTSLNTEIAYAEAERDQLAGRLDAQKSALRERSEALKSELMAAEAARDRARERRANAADAVEAARRLANAHNALASPQFVSLEELNTAERARTEAEDSLALADAAFDAAQARLVTARGGYFYGDARSTGNDPAALATEIAELERMIEAETVRIDSLNAQREEYSLVSPCHCRVADLSVLPGERVAPIAPIARLHQIKGAAQVAAFIRHRDARNLEIGGRATVRMADGRVDSDARIERIRSNVRLVNETRLVSRSHNPESFSEVTIRLSDGFEDAPIAGADVTLTWSLFGWLERAFYFSA